MTIVTVPERLGPGARVILHRPHQRSPVFRYICDHIVPGCPKVDEDESREDLMRRVGVHLRDKHDLDHREDRIGRALEETGVVFIRPA